jgi:nucleolar protein 6
MSKEPKDKQAKQEKEEKRARKEAKREKKRLTDEAAAAIAEPVQPVGLHVDLEGTKDSKKSMKRKLDDEAAEEPKKSKKSKKSKNAVEDVIVAPAETAEVTKKAKKSKKSKSDDEAIPDAVAAPVEPVEATKKSKKSKKRKSETDKATNGALATDDEVSKEELAALKKKAKRDGKAAKGSKGAASGDSPAEGEDADTDAPSKKGSRFIVFIGMLLLYLSSRLILIEPVGQLPYTATEESIKKHFIKIRPTSIRFRKKGFAFMDFDNYDRMKTCLNLYHHSMFDDGISPARQINVELTVGGGGNTENRKSKIMVKNERLNEQRERREIEEKRVKDGGEPKVSGSNSTKKLEKVLGQTPEKKPAKPKGEAHTGIHPSRLNRLLF